MKHIAAFTEMNDPYVHIPGYIATMEEGDKTFAVVRTRVTGEQARVEINKAQLIDFAKAILNFYNVPEIGI